MFSIQNSFIYFFGTFINALPQLLLLPLISSYFPVEDFALLSIFSASSAIIICFIAFNSFSYAQVEFFKGETQLNKNISAINILLLISLVALTVFVSFILFFFNVYFIEKYYFLIYFSIIHASVLTLINLRLSILQMQDDALIFIALQLFISISGLIISYILIKNYDMGLIGRIIGMIIPSFVAFVIISCAFQRKVFLNIRSSLQDITKVFQFGVSFIQYKLIKQLRAHTDKFIIIYYLGLVDAGIYAMALSVSIPIMLLNTSFDKILTPRIIKLFSTLQNKNIYKALLPYITFALIGLIFFSTCYYLILINFFDIFIDEQYSRSLSLVHIIIAGTIFQGLNSINMVAFSFFKKGMLLSKLSYIIYLVQLLASFLLITTFGLDGGAYGYLFSYLAGFVITSLMLIKYQSNFIMKKI
ncbi:MAG: lipopolysaccharide biosynthesis protein [SAR86 cluster bacterium]|nr:lipopolysaccharide biosynthesis protein [SAR86 cluster bacterium]